MKKISKLLVGFSFALPVLFLLLSKTGTADTMDKMKALENAEIATLAGGCFWCTESDLEQLPGVLDVVSGYSGGHVNNPTYRQVSSGKTGHIESIEVKYDPNVVNYEQVLDYFSATLTQPTIKDHLSTEVHSIDLLFSTTTQSKSRSQSSL